MQRNTPHGSKIEEMSNTAFDFGEQPSGNLLISLFDDNTVTSPDSYVSTTSEEDMAALYGNSNNITPPPPSTPPAPSKPSGKHCAVRQPPNSLTREHPLIQSSLVDSLFQVGSGFNTVAAAGTAVNPPFYPNFYNLSLMQTPAKMMSQGTVPPCRPAAMNCVSVKKEQIEEEEGEEEGTVESSNNGRKKLKRGRNNVVRPKLVDNKPSVPLSDKEIKRQKRLIKNREAAQASRDRKKFYVQNLEKKLSDLEDTNSSLTDRVTLLEEENKRLREKLISYELSSKHIATGEHSEKHHEPEAKRRRISEINNTSQNSSNNHNPLNLSFWTNLIQQSIQEDVSSTSSNKKVVLFIMVICVALLVSCPKAVVNNNNGDGHIASSPVSTDGHNNNVEMENGVPRVAYINSNNPSSLIENQEMKAKIENLKNLESKIREAWIEFESINLDRALPLDTAGDVPSVRIKKKNVLDDMKDVSGGMAAVKFENNANEDIEVLFGQNKHIMLKLPFILSGKKDVESDESAKLTSLYNKFVADIGTYFY